MIDGQHLPITAVRELRGVDFFNEGLQRFAAHQFQRPQVAVLVEGPSPDSGPARPQEVEMVRPLPLSYSHLTLPTIWSV